LCLLCADSGRSRDRKRTGKIDPKPSFRLTRRCSIRELALADEAGDPTTAGIWAATDYKTAPGHFNAVEYLRIFGGIDFGHS